MLARRVRDRHAPRQGEGSPSRGAWTSAPAQATVPAMDRGVSRNAGSFSHHGGSWWLHNDSGSSVLCVLGDR